MREAVAAFVRGLPERLMCLHELWQQQAFDGLERASRELAFVAGGFGLGALAASAGRLEGTLIKLNNGAPSASIDSLYEHFRELVNAGRSENP